MDDNRKIPPQSQKEHWFKMVREEYKPFIETNAIIARFMGYEIDDTNQFFSGIHYYNMDSDTEKKYNELTIDDVRSYTEGFVWHYTYIGNRERRYDNDYGQLMEVVEKIEKMDYGFKMCRKVVEVYIDSTKEVILKTKESCRFESLYKSVFEFVKWHYTLT